MRTGKAFIHAEPSVYIFTGHYGSGKTESAVNFARFLRRLDPSSTRKIALLDMDTVNPFFRSADAEEFLRANNIRLEAPLYANSNVDMPALPGTMGALIRDPSWDVILDIGGDDMGARAVGCYSEDILARTYERFFVINALRPFTETVQAAGKIFDEIGGAANVPATAIINNTNLLDETEPSMIFRGLKLAEELAASRGLSVAFNMVPEAIVDAVLAENDPRVNAENTIPLERTVKRLF